MKTPIRSKAMHDSHYKYAYSAVSFIREPNFVRPYSLSYISTHSLERASGNSELGRTRYWSGTGRLLGWKSTNVRGLYNPQKRKINVITVSK